MVQRNKNRKILVTIGTRPEAIKMAPLISSLKESNYFVCELCITAQHREMLDQVLKIFNLKADYDLNLMKKNQSLANLSSNILNSLQPVLEKSKPDLLLVHGDTTTTMISSLAAFYNHIPIAHVEAGLRTGNLKSPWPEEANRIITGKLSKIHFSPTKNAKNNLLKEGIPDKAIFVTGNTVIDSLFQGLKTIENNKDLQIRLDKKYNFISGKKLLLVTGHRRENFGDGILQICLALAEVARKKNDVVIVYPVHLNPNISSIVNKILGKIKNVFLIDPVEYLDFIYLMNMSFLILTDSGGIQEEAPSLGVPVLVTRNTTERPEAVESGSVRIVGTDKSNIIKHIFQLLENDLEYKKMSVSTNPYGDGKSVQKINKILEESDEF